MTDLTHENLVTMLTLQRDFLDAQRPDWKSTGDFLRSAWICAALLSGSIQVDDKDDMEADFVCVIRKLLTAWLADTPDEDSIDDSAGLLLSMMTEEQKWSAKQEAVLQAETDPLKLLDAFAHMASASMFNIKLIERVGQLLGYTWADTTQMVVEDCIMDGAPANTAVI